MATGRTNAGGMSTADATAKAEDILEGKTAYAGNEKVEGTMVNNTAEAITLDASSTSYTIPAGYHDGAGEVNLVLQEKSISSSTSTQYVYPDSGCVLSKVTVWGASSGTNVSNTTLTAANARSGYYFYDSSGNWTQGTMATYNNADGYNASSSHIYVTPSTSYQYIGCKNKYMPYNVQISPISFSSPNRLSSEAAVGVDEKTAEYVAFGSEFESYAENAKVILIVLNDMAYISSSYESIEYSIGGLFTNEQGEWVPRLALMIYRQSSSKMAFWGDSSSSAYLSLNITSSGTQYESTSPSSIAVFANDVNTLYDAYFF